MRVPGVLAAQSGDITAPAIPQNVSATAINAGRVDLSWTASTDDFGVQGYQIYRNGSPLTTTGSTTYSDTTCQPSTLYSYTIAAFDFAGNNSQQSNAASATTPANAAPVWQSVPAQTLIVGNSYLLQLTDYCTDADLDSLTFSIISGTLPSGIALSTNRLQGTPTTAGQTPTITVRAADVFHQIDTTIAFQTYVADGTAPPVPTGLAASAVSSSQINVSWNASTDVAGVANELVTGTKDYRVYRDGSLRTTQAGTSYSDTGLSGSTSYAYRVSARDNALNESAQATQVTATTQQAGSSFAHGATASISGSGFGAIAVPTYLNDDFSTGTLNALIENTSASGFGDWDTGAGSDHVFRRNTISRGVHTRVAHHDIDSPNYVAALCKNDSFTGDWFIDFWRQVRLKPANTTPGWTRNHKVFRFYDQNGDGDHFACTYIAPGNGGWPYYYTWINNPQTDNQMSINTWEHFQIRFRRGATIAADVMFAQRAASGSTMSTLYNGGWRDSGHTSSIPTEFRLGDYWATDADPSPGGVGANAGADIYTSSILIQNTWARVELGNHPTYDSATIREPQLTLSRTDTNISFRVNQGALSPGTVYIYAINASNTLVSTTARTMT